MRKVQISLVSLSILCVLLGLPASGNAQRPVQCAAMAWSPEMFSFYGDKDAVLAKFQKLDRDLLNHRVYAFVVESKQGSKLTFFERNGDSTMDLAAAKGLSFNDLSNQITTTLLANNGHKCSGMTAKELVANYTQGNMVHTSIPRPASAGEAFRYALSETEGEYVRATFILLC